MKKTLIRILSIVLCLALVSGGAAFSYATEIPATNSDAVATPDVPEAPASDTAPFRISVTVNGDTQSSKGFTWYTKSNTDSVVNIYDENGEKVNGVTYADVF